MRTPPDWSSEQLNEGRRKAIALFRKQRMEEPLEAYLRFFEEYEKAVQALLDASGDLMLLDSKLDEVLQDPRLLEAFRYLAGPPISLDDLTILAEANLSRKSIKANPEMAAPVLHVVREVLDSGRFPWVGANRKPTRMERRAAIVASAALIASSRTGTLRRNEGKKAQEALVGDGLVKLGFKEIKRRRVVTLSDAPLPGHFCAESMLGNTRADFVVGLWDKRILGIECKVSNSAVNSYKRLNHEAVGKAVSWLATFGTNGVVPVVVLSGVYTLDNLIEAQARGATIFWSHDLDQLLGWIDAEKPPNAGS